MEESITQKLDGPGKRMSHAITGLEIKLLKPNGKGWRAQVMGLCLPLDYVVNLTHEDLMKRFRDVKE